jgi:hypothetical protein
MVTKAVILVIGILLTQSVNAQRPSVADLQAQIDALTFPYDEPAAQVASALDLLPLFQHAVVEYFRQTGGVPANRLYAGLTPNGTDTQTSFVSGVDIIDGTIVVTYGNDADPLIANQLMTFTPYESPDGSVVWRCGNDLTPSGSFVPLGSSGPGPAAPYLPPTIPPSTHPSPCLLEAQSGPDEVIRAQVLEVFDVLETIQDAVEAAGAALGSPSAPVPPQNRVEAGLTQYSDDTRGIYFSDVEILDGTIVVHYYGAANESIRGMNLAFQPYESGDGTIAWRCGNAPAPSGNPMGSAAGWPVSPPSSSITSVEHRFLPHACRP